MQLVVIREGRVGMHVGDVVEVNGDETTVFDLTFFSHIESEASQKALALKAGDKPDANTKTKKEGAE